MADYAISWIIRFAGTLTQGPNKGKTYTYADSWGGLRFDSEATARAALARYQAREPQLAYQLLVRQWQGQRNGHFVETLLPL